MAFVEQHSYVMIAHGAISTVYEWCSTFPEEVMQARPMLCILQCWPWVLRYRNENRDRIEARLRQAEQAIAALKDQLLGEELNAHATVVRSYLMMAPDPAADAQGQLALARNTLSDHPQGSAGQFSVLLAMGYAHMALHDAQAAEEALGEARQVAYNGRLFSGIVESTFQLAYLAHSHGTLQRAVEICRGGKADIMTILPHTEQGMPALGCLDIALGRVLLEQDRLEEAEHHLLHGLDRTGWGINAYYSMTACAALFRLRQIQGRPVDAGAFLSRLEAAWPDVSFYIQGLQTAVGPPEADGTGPAGGTGSPGTAVKGSYAQVLESGECLSQRELDVLRLIAQGASNQVIADRLVITVGTAKSHVNHILGKLAARNRTEAVARARVLGILDF